LVSHAVQSTAGLLTGIVVYGCALGGIFSLVFAYAYGRIGSLSPRSTAAILAILGFVALILVPQIKYSANPPPIGEPPTIATRTALYFTMISLSVIATVAATRPPDSSRRVSAMEQRHCRGRDLSRRDNSDDDDPASDQ
jgi:hypothetical protein